MATTLQSYFATATQKACDELIEAIGSLNLRRLNLRRNPVSNVAYLKHMTGLLELDLSETDLGSQGLKIISNLKKLQILRLDKTKISDADLVHLYPLKTLAFLGVRGCTNLSREGIEKLRAQIPHCSIEFDRQILPLANPPNPISADLY